jgi:hypothetical protein
MIFSAGAALKNKLKFLAQLNPLTKEGLALFIIADGIVNTLAHTIIEILDTGGEIVSTSDLCIPGTLNTPSPEIIIQM